MATTSVAVGITRDLFTQASDFLKDPLCIAAAGFGGAIYGAGVGAVSSVKYTLLFGVSGGIQAAALFSMHYVLTNDDFGLFNKMQSDAQMSTARKICSLIFFYMAALATAAAVVTLVGWAISHVLVATIALFMATVIITPIPLVAGFVSQLVLGAPFALYLLAVQSVRWYLDSTQVIQPPGDEVNPLPFE